MTIKLKRLLVICKWFLGTIPFELFTFSAFLLGYFAWWFPKTFNWYLDDHLEDEDYKVWFKGRKNNFLTFVKWHIGRNRMQNLRYKIAPPKGDIVLTDVIIDDLYRNGKKVPPTETAAYKWIDDYNNEGWQVNKGVIISQKYSTIGETYIYFKMGDKNYFRYSLGREIKLFGRIFYLTIKLGTSDKRNVLTIKIQLK